MMETSVAFVLGANLLAEWSLKYVKNVVVWYYGKYELELTFLLQYFRWYTINNASSQTKSFNQKENF